MLFRTTQWISVYTVSLSRYWMLFNVQVADISDYEFDLRADEKVTAENKGRNEDDTIPVKFNCYKMLINAKPNPDVVESIGEYCSFTCSCLFFLHFTQALKSLAIQWPHSEGEYSCFFSPNRNSNSCSDAGTRTEES